MIQTLRWWRGIGVAAALALCSGVAQARVEAVERDGFSLTLRQDVVATPDALFAALTRPGAWWSPEHSWSGDTANFSFETRAGGCWCEALPDGGSVEHGRLIAYQPRQRSIVMQSLLGPLQSMAMTGRLNWRVEAGDSPGTSRLIWVYQVSMMPSGNPAQDAALAAGVDHVLAEQMARLIARVTRDGATP